VKTPRDFLIGIRTLDRAGVRTWLQFRCLAVIHDTPGAITKQICSTLETSTAGTHAALVELEEEGFVISEKVPSRGMPANSYRLTNKGRDLFQQVAPAAA